MLYRRIIQSTYVKRNVQQRLAYSFASSFSSSSSSSTSSSTPMNKKNKHFKRLAELKKQLALIDDTKLDDFIFEDNNNMEEDEIAMMKRKRRLENTKPRIRKPSWLKAVPPPLDPEEPEKVAAAISRYVYIYTISNMKIILLLFHDQLID